MSSEVARLCEEIKSKHNLTEYIDSKGIEINRAGFISCIFHKENTPSCQINKGKDSEWFYCHGCHKSGSIIDFYAQIEGISDGAAIHALSKDVDFSYNLEDMQRALEKVEEEPEEDVISGLNVMISVHIFRYLRKVKKYCPKEIVEEEFVKIDKMFKKLDESLRGFDEGRVSDLYKKICIDNFLIDRFKSLEKENEADN